MSDMAQTWILRVVVFLAVTVAIMFAIAVLNEVIRLVAKEFIDRTLTHSIEQLVFIIVLTGKLWDWVTARIWIGRRKPTDT